MWPGPSFHEHHPVEKPRRPGRAAKYTPEDTARPTRHGRPDRRRPGGHIPVARRLRTFRPVMSYNREEAVPDEEGQM